MMCTIEKNCEGCTIYSLDRKKLVKHILSLVDDTRQCANDWNDNYIVQILNHLQESSRTLEHTLEYLLNTTGVKLEILKCDIYTL